MADFGYGYGYGYGYGSVVMLSRIGNYPTCIIHLAEIMQRL